MLKKYGFSSDAKRYLKQEWLIARQLLDDYSESLQEFAQEFTVVDEDDIELILGEHFYRDGFQAGVDDFDAYCAVKRADIVLFTCNNGTCLLKKDDATMPNSWQIWLCESD